jgi:hypothetical protein
MKRTTTLLLCSALAIGLKAQSYLNITDPQGAVVNGMTVQVDGQANDPLMELDLSVTLLGTATDVIGLKRYEVNVVPATINYFCWFECYVPWSAGQYPLYVAPDPVQLSESNAFTGFHAYYNPNGVSGSSTFRYVWYTADGSTDSVFVNIVFNASPVGLAEQVAERAGVSASPNPCNGGAVKFTFTGTPASQGGTLMMRNTLGEVVRSMRVTPGQRDLTMFADGLANGIWFASLEKDGRMLATQRLVITAR